MCITAMKKVRGRGRGTLDCAADAVAGRNSRRGEIFASCANYPHVSANGTEINDAHALYTTNRAVPTSGCHIQRAVVTAVT
eukprot:6320310-Pyramimonas_sp.AAC.1